MGVFVTRSLRAASLLLLTLAAWAVPAAAGGFWEGTWSVRWRGGGAAIELEQDGPNVTGSYPLYEGVVSGTVEGGRLTGQWVEL